MIVFFFCVNIWLETGETKQERGFSMVKMALFDIDGTLRDEREGLPQSAVRAVGELKKNGILVCVCTGRSLETIYDEVMALEPDGVIAGGGSYITLGKTVQKQQAFHPEQIQACMEWTARAKHAGISMESHREAYMNGIAARMLSRANAEKWKGFTRKEQERAVRESKIICRDNFTACNPLEEPIHKICYWGSREGFEELRDGLGPCRVVQMDFWSGTRFYELVPEGCDKGTAVRELCVAAGIRPEDTIGFGDGKNDLDFLKVTGISVAMENGAKEVKDMADSICESPARHGIYRELVRRKLIQGEERRRYDGA